MRWRVPLLERLPCSHAPLFYSLAFGLPPSVPPCQRGEGFAELAIMH